MRWTNLTPQQRKIMADFYSHSINRWPEVETRRRMRKTAQVMGRAAARYADELFLSVLTSSSSQRG